MNKLALTFLFVSATGAMLAGAPDPVQAELQKLEKQAVEIRKTTKNDSEVLKFTESVANDPKQLPAVRSEYNAKLMYNYRRWTDVEKYLKAALALDQTPERHKKYISGIMSRSGYFDQRDRVSGGKAILAIGDKDPLLSPEDRLNLATTFCSIHRIPAAEAYAILSSYPIPADAQVMTIYNRARCLAGLAVNRTVYYMDPPTAEGYEEGCRILSEAITKTAGHQKTDLQVQKCGYLLELGKLKEADALAEAALKENEKMQGRPKAALIAVHAKILLIQGRYQAAYDCINTIPEDSRKPYYNDQAKAAMALGNYPETVRLMELFLKFNRAERNYSSKIKHVKSLADAMPKAEAK